MGGVPENVEDGADLPPPLSPPTTDRATSSCDDDDDGDDDAAGGVDLCTGRQVLERSDSQGRSGLEAGSDPRSPQLSRGESGELNGARMHGGTVTPVTRAGSARNVSQRGPAAHGDMWLVGSELQHRRSQSSQRLGAQLLNNPSAGSS